MSSDLRATLTENCFYHVICKSINRNVLFLSDENRLYFLQRYQYYLSGFVDTYAYCLMTNHVHWLIKVKKEETITAYLQTLPDETITQTQQAYRNKQAVTLNTLLEKQYNSFLVSYTRSFNLMYRRSGGLFDRSFRRIAIGDDAHFTQAVIYIHGNPVKHKVTDNFTNYKWSSYQAMLSQSPTSLRRDEVLNWFGGKNKFVELHRNNVTYYYDFKFSGEYW